MTTYAERPWTKMYDPWVPESIDYPDISLPDQLRQAAQKDPSSPALVTSTRLPSILGKLGRLGTTVTYGELDRASDALAAAFIDMGLKHGDRVALVMPNCVAFVVAFYATLKAGGTVAATNPTYPPGKMQFQLNDSDAKIAIVLSAFYEQVKDIQAETQIERVIVANIKEYFAGLPKILFTLTREKKDGHFVESLDANDLWFQDVLGTYHGQKPNVTVKSTDTALFQYTGGTTGVSKAAMATHAAMVANTMQCDAYLGTHDDPDSFLGAIPMFHVFGLVAVLSFAVGKGAPIYLVPNPRDIPDLLDTIDTYKPTLFMGVPALYNAINNHPDVQAGNVSLKSIRACISGSAPLAPATKQEFERLSGGYLVEGYGMSETPTATHCNPLKGENRTGSIGLPFPDMDVRIVSLDDGETDVPVGDVGELVVCGPQMMRGYHKMPTESANALRDKDGKVWLYTGDIARMDDDGYFYIVDRKKDMALIGGFNVYPNAIEKVLAAHPAVHEVGVAAIPHPEKEGQEALKAWIVFRDGQGATKEELIEYCSRDLAPYEVPRRYSFVPELPKSTVGKTLRRELIRLEMEEREAQQSQAQS